MVEFIDYTKKNKSNGIKENKQTNLNKNTSKIINFIAPEHLHLHVEEKDKMIDYITNAGCIFMGEYTTEAFGDYILGTNHILPTSGSVPIGARNGVNQVLPLNSYSQLYLVYNNSGVYTDVATVIDSIQVSTPSTNLVNATVEQLQEQMNYAYGYSAANSTGFVNIPIINPIFGKLSGRLVTDIDTSQLTVTVNTTAAAAATGQIFLARDVTNLPVPAQVING